MREKERLKELVKGLEDYIDTVIDELEDKLLLIGAAIEKLEFEE